MYRSHRGLIAVVALVLLNGCAQCVPGRVGAGVARLTVRNVGTMASLANADTTCGFASMAVLSSPTVMGEVGGPGQLRYTMTDCVIDAGDGRESRSCTDVVTTIRGKVTLSGTRTINGTLTGNPQSPIIPSGPDAVTITLEKATFDNFFVETSTSKNKMRMISGSLSAIVSPRLAVSAASGACAIATPNVTFSEVKFAPSKVFVETADNQFEVDVDASSISAQNGVRGDRTNGLSGTVTVWGNEVPAVEKGDTDGLDPDFDLAKFEAGYACTPDLATPVSYLCADLKQRLAGGAARLSVRTLGAVTSLVDANTTCGFSSMAVAGTPAFTGDLGKDNATATFTLAAACTITLPPGTVLSTDCAGVVTSGSGTVAVTGTKRVAGFRTGNPQRPIIPTSPDPAEFDLNLSFTNFEVKNSASTSWLLIRSGALSGEVAPRTGLDSTSGACSLSTPVVTFSDLRWSNAVVRLTSDGNLFDFEVADSLLSAQNGTRGTTSNTVSGAVTIDGAALSLAAGGEPLDVTFNQATFDASYACTPNLVVPPADAACSFRRPLGLAAARLLVKSLATSTSMVNGNTTCGFSAPAVLNAPSDVAGSPGSMGSVTWTVATCAVGPLPANTTISTNCLGGQTKAGGTVTASGSKMVTGMRANNPPIIPVTRGASTLGMTSMVLADFEVFDLPMGAATPTSSSTLTGTGVITLKPIGGESLANAGVFSVTTPVANVESLSMASGSITIRSAGNRFDLALTDVSLTAFVGSFAGSSNELAGSLTVDGEQITVALTTLDPDFVQATFDSTYVCTPDLRAVVPSP